RVLGTRHTRSGPSKDSTGTGCSVLGPQTLVHAQSISAARVLLTVPKVLAQVPSSPSAEGTPRAIAYNAAKPDGTAPAARLVCSKPSSQQDGGPQWTKHLGAAVVALSASPLVTAAALADGSLHWFDTASGARLSAPLMREAPAAHLRCAHAFCLLVDAVGVLSVWDVGRMLAVVDHVSIAPLLYCAELSAPTLPEEEDRDSQGRIRAPRRHRPSVALTAVDVSDAGAPLLSFSDGRSYTYHAHLRTWLRVASPQDHRASDHYTRPEVSDAPVEEGKPLVVARTTQTPLGYLQELGYHQMHATQALNGGRHQRVSARTLHDPAVRRSVTLDHVEQLLRAAAAIGSRKDVVRYADVLARLLAQSGDSQRAA
ncbi:hypothetical protein IW150_007369, partial [Coemansia sp. RSA 2607]